MVGGNAAVLHNSGRLTQTRTGKQITLVQGSLDWEECLTIYREWDGDEKALYSMKIDLQVMPLNVRTEAMSKGYLLIMHSCQSDPFDAVVETREGH